MRLNNLAKIAFVFSAVIILAGCARDLSSNVYTSDATLSLTMEGSIISVRPVTIKNSDELGQNKTGAFAGGALGAAAGSTAGDGSGKVVAVVGGAVAGAIIGAITEDKLGVSQGYEYIVKLDTSKMKSDYYEGSGAMRQVISAATTNGLVTIIQGKDVVLTKGQKVYAIFSDKRARLIPAN